MPACLILASLPEMSFLLTVKWPAPLVIPILALMLPERPLLTTQVKVPSIASVTSPHFNSLHRFSTTGYLCYIFIACPQLECSPYDSGGLMSCAFQNHQYLDGASYLPQYKYLLNG